MRDERPPPTPGGGASGGWGGGALATPQAAPTPPPPPPWLNKRLTMGLFGVHTFRYYFFGFVLDLGLSHFIAPLLPSSPSADISEQFWVSNDVFPALLEVIKPPSARFWPHWTPGAIGAR